MHQSKVSTDCIHSLSKTVSEFTQHSSIHGYKYVTKPDISLLEKVIWIMVHVTAAYVVTVLILNSWQEFMQNPTITTLENPNLPIAAVPFPGVAICSNNKISKRRAWEFAEHFSQRSGRAVNVKDMFNWTKLFGKFYDYEYSSGDQDVLVAFQKVLDKHGLRDGKGTYDTHERLKSLIVDCEELISDCAWDGVAKKCSDIFTFDTTMDGHCCIFNYVPSAFRNSSKIIRENNNRPLISEISGYDNGLTVTVYTNNSDYLYTTIPSFGSSVQIFLSNDYPDTTSGGVIEKVIPVGVEMYVRVEAVKIQTSDDVRTYPIGKRKCIFANEKKTLFGRYSFSDCILQCKIKSILALCLCLPSQYIHAVEDQTQPQCNLGDLVCLDKYKEKWNQMYPFGYDGDEIGREREDSLMCEDCVPMCSDTLYSVKHDYHDIDRTYWKTNDSINYTILHVFFERSVSNLYKQEVVYYWFEIVSMFGGTSGLIIGVSLASIVEFFYFFTVRWGMNSFK